jgi:hypothetical protein
MNIKEAREIISHFGATIGYVEKLNSPTDMFLKANGYIEAHDFRNEEVERLKKLLRNGLAQMVAINGDDKNCLGKPCPNHDWILEVRNLLEVPK